jgi:hypothetical protein
MALTKKQKRAKKKKLDHKVNLEMQRQKREIEIQKEIDERLEHQRILEKNKEEAKRQKDVTDMENSNPKMVMNYIADRNGCGYFRSIFPFELLSTYKNIMSMNSFVYNFEPQILSNMSAFRFQRQATDSQLAAFMRYVQLRDSIGYDYKITYEIDDLLMEIEPSNKIAYDFFDKNKKANHIKMLNESDTVTFSTDILKDIYVKDYGIDENKIKVVKNHLPQFLYSLPYRNGPREFNTTDKKPRVFWSGSASHVGKGGDLSFLIELIEKTVDEYQWVFQGTIPNELINYVKQGKIEFISWVPIYGLANIQFYRARPDICLAPLTPSRFNSCKSDLKYLESCALGAPCITTSFVEKGLQSPYDLSDAEICLEPDADIWKTMIDHLVQNPEYYMEVIKKQYDFLNGRWMETNLDSWASTIN